MVSCRKCGRKGHNLGRHIRARHGLNNAEYLSRYPGAPLTSALYRKRVAGGRKPHVPRDPRYGTPAALSSLEGRIPCQVCGRLYHSLGPHLRSHGISANDYRERYGGPLVSAACRDMHRELTRDLNDGIEWDEQAIITAIQRWAKRHDGRAPTFNAWARSRSLTRRRFSAVGNGHPTATRVQQVFGSWNAGIVAAGLQPRSRGGTVGALRTRCAKGHRLTPDNVRTNAAGIRRCVTCDRKYKREWARRDRAVKRAASLRQ